MVYVYVTQYMTEKDYFYFDRIKGNADHFIIETKKSGGIIQLLSTIKKLKKHKFKKVFLAQVKTAYNRFILSSLNQTFELYSFDDGIGNLIQKGYLDTKDEHFLSQAYFNLFNKKYLYKNFVARISSHFTIYPPKLNIFSNCVPIKLASGISQDKNNIKTVSILLSSPFYDLNVLPKNKNIHIFDQALKILTPDYFLPHPKDTLYNRLDLSNTNVVRTHLIAEEWILEMAKELNIELFSFGSTTLLNLVTSPNVRPVNLLLDEIDNISIFQKFKIESIDIFH